MKSNLNTLRVAYRTLGALGLCLSLFVSLHTGAAESEIQDKIRGPIFDPAVASLKAANQASAAVLAPETYREGASLFTKAEENFEKNGDLGRIIKQLEAAEAKFKSAQQLATKNQTLVAKAFQARQDALNAQAKSRAAEFWQKAEVQLYEATSRAEKGRLSRVERYAQEAEQLFREAELSAIEVVLFAQIDEAIEQAEELDADKWAPQAFGLAQSLLAEARSELSTNRYDTDRPRNLATLALHHAKHAAYIATNADLIDDNKTDLESILYGWEQQIESLAEQFDLPVYFDNGPEQAIADIKTLVLAQKALQEEQRRALVSSAERAQILAEELQQLQSALEGQEEAKARLDQRLAEQKAAEDRIRQVERIFTKEEALVIRSSNQLVIRLIGLGFTSGSSNIEERHQALLKKVEQALSQFPEVPVTIEGHTDAHGVDADNLQLSIARANAIVEYLLTNTPISTTQLSAVGYGEANPIANNETEIGRSKNRRIDVVIYP